MEDNDFTSSFDLPNLRRHLFMAKKRKNQQQQAMQDVQYQAEIADADDLEAQARSKAADQRVKKRQKKK